MFEIRTETVHALGGKATGSQFCTKGNAVLKLNKILWMQELTSQL